MYADGHTLSLHYALPSLGRKPLLMVGAGGSGSALAGVATNYSTGTGQTLLLPALIGFILFFAISQGAVIWVYLSEIFPTAVRARGQSLGSATHWGMNALLAFGFPVVARLTQAAPFWFFAAAMAVQRSEEHTSELQSLMRISDAVF